MILILKTKIYFINKIVKGYMQIAMNYFEHGKQPFSFFFNNFIYF